MNELDSEEGFSAAQVIYYPYSPSDSPCQGQSSQISMLKQTVALSDTHFALGNNRVVRKGGPRPGQVAQ